MAKLASFDELHTYFLQNYYGGKDLDALQYLLDNEHEFPAYQALVMGWKMAILAKLQRADEALVAFESALDAGYWYQEAALRGDSDFASLRGNPRFDELIKRSNLIRAADKLEAKTLIFEAKTPSKKLLIALHGNASNAEAVVPYWQIASDWGWDVALPQSRQGMWLSGHYAWDNVELGYEQILQIYTNLVEKYQPETVVLAGFSMGGAVALYTALQLRLEHVLLLETYPNSLEAMPSLDAETRPHCHVIWGEHDLEEAQKAQDFLQKQQIPYEFESTEIAVHGYPLDFSKRLEAVLRQF